MTFRKPAKKEKWDVSFLEKTKGDDNQTLKDEIELFTMNKWDTDLTQMWLMQLQKPKISDHILSAFQQHNIEGRHLPSLSEEHFIELGFSKIGDRLDLKRAISDAKMSWERYQSQNNVARMIFLKGEGIFVTDAGSLLTMIIEHFTTLPYEDFLVSTTLDFIYGNNFIIGGGFRFGSPKNKAGGFSFCSNQFKNDENDSESRTYGDCPDYANDGKTIGTAWNRNPEFVHEQCRRAGKTLQFVCLTGHSVFKRKSLEELRFEDETGIRASAEYVRQKHSAQPHDATLPVTIEQSKIPREFQTASNNSSSLFGGPNWNTNSNGLFSAYGSNNNADDSNNNSGSLFLGGASTTGSGAVNNSSGGLFSGGSINKHTSTNNSSGGLFSGDTSNNRANNTSGGDGSKPSGGFFSKRSHADSSNRDRIMSETSNGLLSTTSERFHADSDSSGSQSTGLFGHPLNQTQTKLVSEISSNLFSNSDNVDSSTPEAKGETTDSPQLSGASKRDPASDPNWDEKIEENTGEKET